MSGSPGITLKGMHRLEQRVLFETQLDIPSGQWTCILGRSGVGKSTILRLILGLETGGSFEGSIVADDGEPLENRISYMAQSDLLLPWLNLLDNVSIGARLRGDAPDLDYARHLLQRVGLLEQAGQKPATLSGGMRQRTALARTLFEDRPIVCLDEPFSALDAGTRADMQDLAASVLEGRTVLLVTHDPAEAARLGHKIVVMSEQGIRDWPVPEAGTPRSAMAAETVACQGQLLNHLRGAAA